MIPYRDKKKQQSVQLEKASTLIFQARMILEEVWQQDHPSQDAVEGALADLASALSSLRARKLKT